MKPDQLKRSSLEGASLKAIPIIHEGDSLGSLIPVGPWILDVPDLIRLMSEWRARAMRMFLTQFESTPEKTTAYLKDLSIGQPNRILFMIESDRTFLGHIGLACIDNRTAELDNVMRGKSGGSPNLMEASERTLINWAFTNLGLESLFLRILSYNFIAKALHEQMGFQTTQRLPLRRVSKGDSSILEECTSEVANVSFTCDIMALDKADFRNEAHGSS